MAPMMWLILFFYFIVVFLLFISSFYFIYCPVSVSEVGGSGLYVKSFSWEW